MPNLQSLLRPYRENAGLSQQELATKTGVTRQALIAIEAGKQVPSTALALSLARILGCTVEDLFQLVTPSSVEAFLAPAPHATSEMTGRVALGYINNRLVAHRLQTESFAAADGLLQAPHSTAAKKCLIEPLATRDEIKKNIFVSGCAPLLQVLAARIASRYSDARLTWIKSNNSEALNYLRDGFVHIAGCHAVKDPAAMRRKQIVVNLLKWREGLVVAPGNPLGIKTLEDLLRPKLTLAWREEGSGAHQLLTKGIKRKQLPFKKAPAFDHAMVAQMIRFGAADAGVAIEAVAVSAGLGFIPLAEERFDLVLEEVTANQPQIARLLDTLSERSFRREAEDLGYDMSLSGHAARAA